MRGPALDEHDGALCTAEHRADDRTEVGPEGQTGIPSSQHEQLRAPRLLDQRLDGPLVHCPDVDGRRLSSVGDVRSPTAGRSPSAGTSLAPEQA